MNNYSRLTWPHCNNLIKLPCQLNCFSKTIMDLATIPTSQRVILFMPEFWTFFSLLSIFWFSQSAIWTIQDPICFDILGKQLFIKIQYC